MRIKGKTWKTSLLAGALAFTIGAAIASPKNANAEESQSEANVTLPAKLIGDNWGTGGSYAPSTKVTANKAEKTNTSDQKLYGYELSSENAYSRTLKKANTTDDFTYELNGETKTVNIEGYSIPYCQNLTFSVEEAIDTDKDVEFLMSPMVSAGQYTYNNPRFVMALSDTPGQVKALRSGNGDRHGFNANGNYLEWQFGNNTSGWAPPYDNVQQKNAPSMQEPGASAFTQMSNIKKADGTTACSAGMLGLTEAFCGVEVYADSAGARKGENLLVKTTLSFEKSEGAITALTLTFTPVWENDINTSFGNTWSKTYDLSSANTEGDFKLYFGYYNSEARFTDSQIGAGNLSKDRYQVPMSLGLYNYKNGNVRRLGVAEGKAENTINAGETLDLNDCVNVACFDGLAQSGAVEYSSDSDCVNIQGNTLTAVSAGTANITATIDGKKATFKVHVHTHSYSPKSDENNHWEECDCGDKKNVTAHSYDRETVNEKYLKSQATPVAKAVYYKSCACGAFSNGEDAACFEHGDYAVVLGKNIVLTNGAIDLCVYISSEADINQAKVSYTLENGTVKEEIKNLAEVFTTSNRDELGYSGSYKVKFSVSAKMMTVGFTVQAMKDNVPYGEAYTTSVYDYLTNLMRVGDEYDVVAQAMLNYGSAVQSILNYNTDNPAADLKDYDNCFAEGALDVYAAADESNVVKSISIVASSEVALKVYFKDGVTVEGATVAGADYKVGSDYVLIEGIEATEFADKYEIILADGKKVGVSALSFVYVINQTSTATAAYKNLAKAMYEYYATLIAAAKA